MIRCRFCLEPIAGGEWCEDAAECNHRCRLRLGCGRKIANQLRARERYAYRKRRAAT